MTEKKPTAKITLPKLKQGSENVKTEFVIECEDELLEEDKIRLRMESQEKSLVLIKKHIAYLHYSKMPIIVPMYFIALIKRNALNLVDVAIVFVDKLPGGASISRDEFDIYYNRGKDFEKNYTHPTDIVTAVKQEFTEFTLVLDQMLSFLGPNRVTDTCVLEEGHPLMRSREWIIAEQNSKDIARCDQFDKDKISTFSSIGNSYGGLLHEIMVRICGIFPEEHKINKSGDVFLRQINTILFNEKYYNNEIRCTINHCAAIRNHCAHGKQLTEEMLNVFSSNVRALIPILNNIHILKGDKE